MRPDAKVEIRQFRPADLRGLLTLEDLSFPRDAWPGDLFLNYSARWPRLFLIARLGTRITGYILASTRGGQAELASIAVHPRYRGRGIGQALVKRLLSRLKRRAIRRCWLMVRVSNEAAIRFYRELGFRRTRTVKCYYEDGEDGWHMVKR